MTANPEFEPLIREIWLAFADIEAPAGDALQRAWVDAPERPAFERAFQAYGRETIPFEAMMEARFLVSYLTAHAFLYFLPRMIELSLCHGDSASDLEGAVEVAFSMGSVQSPDHDVYRQQIDSLLTPRRRAAVVACIEAWRRHWPVPELDLWILQKRS
jgi:hypothetical protein